MNQKIDSKNTKANMQNEKSEMSLWNMIDQRVLMDDGKNDFKHQDQSTRTNLSQKATSIVSKKLEQLGHSQYLHKQEAVGQNDSIEDDEFQVAKFCKRNDTINEKAEFHESKKAQESRFSPTDHQQQEIKDSIEQTNLKKGFKETQINYNLRQQENMIRKTNELIENNSSSYDDSPSNVRELTEDEIFVQIDKTHHRTGKVVQIKHLNLTDFKRIECPKKNSPHNHKSCYYYHSIKDKRRDDNYYTPELCKFADTEKCPKKDKCRRAHNRVERLYHKDKYKTKFCHCFPNKIQQCEYGDYCSFAHSVEDIKVRLIHHLLPQNQDFDFYIFYFKTEWCPYNHEHNKAQCVYAHNFQDFRRKPNLFRYDTELCEDWQSGTFITCYEEGCKRLQTCHFSHGWKEQQFHPLVYKTQPCEEQKCFKGFECPFYHSTKDRRIIEFRTGIDLEKLFEPKERQFKCSQQPTLMELYFDNNLNHMKELEIANQQEKDTQVVVQEEQRIERSEVNTFVKVIKESKNCSCSGQDKHKELKPQRSFNQEPHDQQSLLSEDQIHESKIPLKQQHSQQILQVTPPRKRQTPEASTAVNRTMVKGSQVNQQQQLLPPNYTQDKYMSQTPTSQQYSFHQSHQRINDHQSPYNIPPLYQSPQNFQQHIQKSQALFNQQLTSNYPQQQMNQGPQFNKQAQCFYPQAYHSPMNHSQQQQQFNNFQRIQSPPGLIHPSQQYMQSQQHTPQHQMYISQQNQQKMKAFSNTIQHRPLNQMNHFQKSYQNQWTPEEHQLMMHNASLKNQDLLFNSQQNNKIFEPQDFNDLNQYYLGGGGQQQQQPSCQKKLNYDRQTPIQKAMTAVELQKKSSQDSDEGSDSIHSNNYDSNNQMNIRSINNADTTTPYKISRDHMMRSCPLPQQSPQQVTPSTVMTDSFYKDKLNNLAESYKRLNLDFNDIQEDEFESEYAANSYNVARSILEQNEQEFTSSSLQDQSDSQKHLSNNSMNHSQPQQSQQQLLQQLQQQQQQQYAFNAKQIYRSQNYQPYEQQLQQQHYQYQDNNNNNIGPSKAQSVSPPPIFYPYFKDQQQQQQQQPSAQMKQSSSIVAGVPCKGGQAAGNDERVATLVRGRKNTPAEE